MLDTVPSNTLRSSELKEVDALASDAHRCKNAWMHVWMQKHMSQPWVHMGEKDTCVRH